MFNLTALIQSAGYLGVFLIVFAESGLFFGFFFPGDSLIFTAGFLASQGYFNIWFLAGLIFIGAVTGDSIGYAFGRRVGPALFKREDSFFFHKRHLETARLFFEKHGGKSIFLARFVPVVRTFTPIFAGVGRMNYPYFLFYNLIGGLIWGAGLSWLGFYLGRSIPNVDKYILPIILLIILLSLLPLFMRIIKHKETRQSVTLTLRQIKSRFFK